MSDLMCKGDRTLGTACGKCQRCMDAAQSELAALREELAKFDEGMRALACSLGAGGYNAEALTADQLVGKIQWGIDNIITVQERRLTAAEQRNAELERDKARIDWLIEQPVDTFYLDDGRIIDIAGRVDVRDAIDEAMAKPTESGASE